MIRAPWLRLLVSAALLAALTLLIDVRTALATLSRITPAWIAPLLAANTLAYVLLAVRWRWFCQRLDLELPKGRALRGVYLFQVTSQVAPSPILGEAARFAVFGRGTPKLIILQSIALDRLSNQLSLALWITALLPYYWSLGYPRWLGWLLPVPALVILGLFAAARRLEGKTWAQRLAFLRLLVRERWGLVPLLLGLALNAVLGLEFWFAAAALPTPASAHLLLLVPLLSLGIALLPISFADWGTRELLALTILAPTGLLSEDIVAVSMLVGVTNLVCSLPGVWLLWGVRRTSE